MSDHVCVLCPVYRPDSDPRYAETVCRADRFRLERDLLAVQRLYHRLADGEDPLAEKYWIEEHDDAGQPTGRWHSRPAWYVAYDRHGKADLRRRDPLAVFDGAAPVAARSKKPMVSGTRAAPVPINVDAVDLTAAPRAAQPTGDPRDQIGYLPVATVLDAWCRYVRHVLHPDFRLPGEQVDDLVAALHRDLPDMCEQLPGLLAQFACDLRALAGAMRVILQDTEPVPQPLLGVRCEHCKKISTLVPWPTGEYTECGFCGQLYSPADREALTKRQVADLRRPRLVRVSGALPGLA